MVATVPTRGLTVVDARARTARAPGRPGRRRVGWTLRVVAAVLVAVVMVFPLWVMLVTAFSSGSAYSQTLRLWPSEPTLDNFTRVFAAWPVGSWFANSVAVAGVTTVLSVTVSLTGGFAFAKLRWAGRTPVFLLLLATMMIPAQAILVPQFRLVSSLGLVGTFWAVILPGAAATFGIFLARQFLMAIPTELVEAARVDGASTPRVFWSIVLPLCRPLIAVLTLLALMYQWNDFLWPLVVLRDPALFTLPIGLQFLQGQYLTDHGALMAMTLLATAPLVVLFLVFQRYFVQGLATTGLR
ncbi:carbohydrate ABC transporter permease [Desertihabitans brevis]|uniref:Carbohydrate ABC transporter permease n=2 Tax=Desertihabitans brevis TaxID=2268447 RepID=A0A367YUN9_9ACTN|nr:carbohydrate ABC transporter permease [Desertihabitans brevis]